MPTYALAPPPKQQFLDDDGLPLAFGKIYTYAAGTTTPLAAYQDSAGTPHANPIVLDAAGRAPIYISNASYKFVVKTSADVTLWTQDNISEPALGVVAGAIVGTTDVQTLSNKTLDNTNAINIKDTSLVIQDNAASTKQFHFVASSITAGQNRAITIPDANTTMVGTDTTQTLTNKTLTAPTINNGALAGTTIKEKVTAYTADGAIAIEGAVAALGKASAGAFTLASPTNPTHDGTRLTLVATTAFAHVVVLTAGFNGGGAGTDTATFGGAVGDTIDLVAIAGIWVVLSTRNVTLS